MIIIMKNFNRRNSHGHHGQSAAKWRNTHTHVNCTHSLTHFTLTQLQPLGAKRQLSHYFSMHAGSVRVFVIHRTLTWTTGSLMWSFLCVRIHTGLGNTDSESAQHFWLGKTLKNIILLLTVFETGVTDVVESWVRRSTNSPRHSIMHALVLWHWKRLIVGNKRLRERVIRVDCLSDDKMALRVMRE